MNKLSTIFYLIALLGGTTGCKQNESESDPHAQHKANVLKTKHDGRANLDLMLTDSQIKLANVTTQVVSLLPVGETIVVNARLVQNEELTEVVSSRVAGRIDRLYVKETGVTVQKGQPLYQLYSETLLTLQKEFLLAKDQYETLGKTEKRYKSFYDAARRKLLLYGLTDTQIRQLSTTKDIQSTITFSSPASGIISEVAVAEGQYVSEGSIVMNIDNVSEVWVEAELFPDETRFAKRGDKIAVKVSPFEGPAEDAIIEFLSPEFRANSQVMIMRASLPNPDLKYKPGMQAQVFFSHSTKKGLTVPVDAVIRDGKGTHLYVQKGMNNFRPQTVKTGLEDFERVEITEGLSEGDTVVISGAYLLYSEIILKRGIDPNAHAH
jgi:membrane fusion protein, copper/silver efflux system